MSTITLKAILLAIIFIIEEIRKIHRQTPAAATSDYNRHEWAMGDIYREHFQGNP